MTGCSSLSLPSLFWERAQRGSGPELSLGRVSFTTEMVRGVEIPPRAGGRTKDDSEGQGAAGRAIWPRRWPPAAHGDNLLHFWSCHGLGLGWSLPVLQWSLLQALAPAPQTPGPRLHAVPAGLGIASSQALMPLYPVIADDPGRRQRCGEDVSAGPV